jgi:hypothetical protein
MADSPLFVKTYDLLYYLIPVTQGFPRSQRFVLAKRIQDAALDFYEGLLEARKVDLETRAGCYAMLMWIWRNCACTCG